MILDLSIKKESEHAKTYINKLIESESVIELRKIVKTRSVLQNRALHQFFVLISFALNELGNEFSYTGVKGSEISTMYTPDIVKNFFWRPIQIALFDIKSTKDINTEQINKIADVVIRFFDEKGVLIEFPSMESKNK